MMVLIRRLIVLMVSGVFIWVIGQFLSQDAPSYDRVELDALEKIIETGQFILTPSIEYKGDQGYLSLQFIVNCFQEPRLLDMNYKEQLYLEVNNGVVASSPIITSKEISNYKLTMQLTFDLGRIRPVRTIKLTVFTFSDNEFIWTI